MANITFQEDYGSLSTKTIRKILPHLKDGNQYDVACEYAGYKHSKILIKRKKKIKETKVIERIKLRDLRFLTNSFA